ncbi:MAG: hypothetical protein HN370_04540 [Phycisphaerales bacterium]|jgi:hypothetical protein|nr:hypothetical protein [Phycisphaerales bacterium]
MKFSHVGIPTTETKENENYLEGAKLFVTDFATCDYAIEFLRFEDDSPMPDLLKTTAHVAFEVEDMTAALEGKEVLIPPFEPMEGVQVAFIVDNGAPVEFMQVSTPGEGGY